MWAAARPGRLARRRVFTRMVKYMHRWEMLLRPVRRASSQASAPVEHPILQAASEASAPRSGYEMIGAAKLARRKSRWKVTRNFEK